MKTFHIQHATDITDLCVHIEQDPPEYTQKNAEGVYSGYRGSERVFRVTLGDPAFAMQVETALEHGEQQ